MSRRAAGPDRAAQNQQTLKSLVKLEANKTCADCKRNKHPRWASWNLGVFICIRCSGIHRGMGTHISRVKSVDLDSWTDEQLQSILRWGNARANKYWEAKLAPGHVPQEAKIENFIRTKYDSKRWVMDGPMPDPSTLDVGGDDDVPLNVVQEKAKLERAASQRAASASSRPAPPPQRTQNIDLFGDDGDMGPPRPNTTEPPISRPPPKAEPAPPKKTTPGDSLLGLDFFGGTQSAPPARPSSTSGTSSGGAPSRPDLKQSILSLYASAPKPAPQPQAHARGPSFGGMQSPPPPSSPPAAQSSFGGLNDAFSGLSMTSPPAQQTKPSPFAGLTSPSSQRPPATSTSSRFGGGGSFFDTASKATPPAHQKQPSMQRTTTSGSGFGDFFSATSPGATTSPAATKPSSSGDLFNFSMPASTPAAPAQPAAPPPQSNINSAFNLSKPAPPPQTSTINQASGAPNYSSGFSNMDAWGSNDVWGSSEPAAPAAPAAQKSPPVTQSNDSGGWGSSSAENGWGAPAKPAVSADEDFGGWSTAAPAAPAPSGNTAPSAKPVGGFGGGSDDLFSNVWE